MRFLAHQFDRVAVLILLIITEGVFWPPDAYFSAATGQLPRGSDPYSIAFNAALIAFLALAYFVRSKETLPVLRSAWPILPLLTLAYLSALWSVAPDIVLVRATKVAATALFGVYLIGRSDMAGFVALFVKASLAAVAASLLISVFSPDLALSTNPDYTTAWRGAFTDKNELGLVAALGELFAIYAFSNRYGSRWLSGIAVPANLLLLYRSDSITSVILLPIGLYVGLLGSAFRRRNRAGLAAAFGLLLLGVIGAAVLAGEADQVAAELGRNLTLTNRTRIWELVIPYIARRPWLGYGLETFWLPQGVEANQVWAMLQWQAPHAHNVWFEMCLSLGLIGAAFAAFLWVSAFWRAVRLLFGPPAPDVPFCLVLLVAIFVQNLVEYTFFRGDEIAWALFAATFAHLGRTAAARRRPRMPFAAASGPRFPVAAPAYPAAR